MAKVSTKKEVKKDDKIKNTKSLKNDILKKLGLKKEEEDLKREKVLH